VTSSRSRTALGSHETRALLLRRVDYGESDLVVALFTEQLGRVSALARGARRSSKRFGGALEPLHTLHVRCDEPRHGDLFVLREARIAVPRARLTQSLDRMQAAGRALSWVRRAAPPRTAEPEVWQVLENLLDALGSEEAGSAQRELAVAGLGLLGAFGWAIDFERCVRCGKRCPEAQPAMVDAAHGGLLCRACGGARTRLSADQRLSLARAAAGVTTALQVADTELALELVEQAMRAHAGLD
jgi:DNA repair protein RecO (recombination protein O)